MFHQSFHGCEKYPPAVALTEKEKFLYCDPLLYRYMGVLIKNDSSGYSFLYDPDLEKENNTEFKQNNQIEVVRWME